MHYDERDATLRYIIVADIIKSRGEVDPKDWVSTATTVYEFVTQSGNSPARKKETAE